MSGQKKNGALERKFDMRTTAIRDLIILAVITALSYFKVPSFLGIQGKPYEYARFSVLAFSLCWFTIRRLREWQELAASRKRAILRLEESEEELNKVLFELKRSNEELEQFVYVASHDLQEPLRKIQAFGDRLKAKCDDALDDRGRDYLQRMQSAAVRMRTLIEDLLSLSRVTTRGQPFVKVNLAEVAEGVISDLEILIERVGGRVEVGDLPTITADRTQMRQLLQNLIGNALKFRRPDFPPVVKVHSECRDDACELVVEDNGIGFDEKCSERIFEVFQ